MKEDLSKQSCRSLGRHHTGALLGDTPTSSDVNVVCNCWRSFVPHLN